MQFFNKKFFLYVTLTLSCGIQVSLANTEEDANIAAKCPDPYSLEEGSSKYTIYTISCAKLALEKLGEADDVDSTIKATEIVLKARGLFAETDDTKAVGLDHAEAQLKEARAKAVEKLSPFIHSDEKNCQRALNILKKVSPIERRRLKKREEEGIFPPCAKKRGNANEPCAYKGNKCRCESEIAPIACGCKNMGKWCECKNNDVCD